MTSELIGGHVSKGWETVGNAFRDNFSVLDDDPGDLGASLCVVSAGRTVVDLWGGWADRGRTRPWQPDTLVNSYSVGKGITSTVALAAVSRGLLSLDDPLRRCWPELRSSTTLRQAMSHQAGLPALRDEVPGDLPLDWTAMCCALAATDPWWEPGTAHGYHTNTFGFLVGEPTRRVASAKRFGDLLREWVAQPVEADVWFGVGDDDLKRCSEVDLGSGPLDPSTQGGGGPGGGFDDEHQRMIHHAYFNPSTLSGMGIIETKEWRQAEVPSTNGHFTAKGVARIYASLLDPSGPVDRAVLGEATSTQADGTDLVLGKSSRYGLGFQLHLDERPIGVTPASFGHFGFGGSIGFADPDADISVGYLLNRPGDRWQMPRTRRLLAALREVVGA